MPKTLQIIMLLIQQAIKESTQSSELMKIDRKTIKIV